MLTLSFSNSERDQESVTNTDQTDQHEGLLNEVVTFPPFEMISSELTPEPRTFVIEVPIEEQVEGVLVQNTLDCGAPLVYKKENGKRMCVGELPVSDLPFFAVRGDNKALSLSLEPPKESVLSPDKEASSYSSIAGGIALAAVFAYAGAKLLRHLAGPRHAARDEVQAPANN